MFLLEIAYFDTFITDDDFIRVSMLFRESSKKYLTAYFFT